MIRKSSFLIVIFYMNVTLCLKNQDQQSFYKARAKIIKAEANSFMGAHLPLNPNESKVNEIVMKMKHQELTAAYNRSHYPPSQTFFRTFREIEQSPVFEFLRNMPKGGALHVHDISLVDVAWVVSNLTYRDDLHMCRNDGGTITFSWFKSSPLLQDGCRWESVKQARAREGPKIFDKFLHSKLIINRETPYQDVNSAWIAFGDALAAMATILSHKTAFADYFYRALEEFKRDGVQYMEIRTVLLETVCTSLEGSCDPLSQIELAELYQDVAKRFTEENQDDFCGVRMIFAPLRSVNATTVTKDLELADVLMRRLPDFFVGFDLVGQEGKGAPLIDFAKVILEAAHANPILNFFFHAGETNWEGGNTDANVIDAVLLGTKRIGHGYAIIKHPEALKIARTRDIPLEICPISNQVLGLVSDLRNHPATTLIQDNSLPVVISSDDPGAWGIPGGLSYDFYETFMGLAGRDMDIRLLKQLVLNSIRYSAMKRVAKAECKKLVKEKWHSFVLEKRLSEEIRDDFLPEIETEK